MLFGAMMFVDDGGLLCWLAPAIVAVALAGAVALVILIWRSSKNQGPSDREKE